METQTQPKPIFKQLTGTPIERNGQTLQPFAQLRGVHFANAAGGGAFVAIEPQQVVVRDANGVERTVPITNINAQTIRSLFFISLATWLILFIVRVVVRVVAK